MGKWGADSDRLEDAGTLELQRQEIVMRRFFRQEGVLDRYMRVYHPRAEGAPDSHNYLEITNGARTKVAILQDSKPNGEVWYIRSASCQMQSTAWRFCSTRGCAWRQAPS